VSPLDPHWFGDLNPELGPDYPADRSPATPHFDSLANSAFDFLRKAFAEVGEEPKYSVIHFFTGVELVFKARLMREHWALIVLKPEEASLDRFKAGDFLSVSLKQALDRLRRIVGETFTKEEQECFRKLGDHRNQIVHFFHKGYADEPEPEIVADVAAEQFRAWIYVHKLLTQQWDEYFDEYSDTIFELNGLIRSNKQFLAEKLRLATPEIQSLQKDGCAIISCDACGSPAVLLKHTAPPLMDGKCLVCGHRQSVVTMSCKKCGEIVEFTDTGEGECAECDTAYDIKDLIAEFGPDSDPDEEPDTAYCPECARTDHQTVVPYGEEYLCLNCAYTFASIGNCGWCSEAVAGDLDGSYLTGCLFCEGQLRHDRD